MPPPREDMFYLVFVCLFVFIIMVGALHKSYRLDLHEIFTRDEFKFCKSSGEHRQLSRLNNTHLVTNSYNNYWSDLLEHFARNVTLDKEVPIKFWNSSRESRPVPRPNDTLPDQIIIINRIFMKIFLLCSSFKCLSLPDSISWWNIQVDSLWFFQWSLDIV